MVLLQKNGMLSYKNKVVLLMNLGSPDSTAVKDVRRYLNEFLMDERVIDIPYWIRAFLVKGIIVPLRAPRSAKAYKSIWTPTGSPLINISKDLQQAVQAQIQMPVELCMRYGSDAPKEVLDNIAKKYPTVDEVILLPLYPHYAMSSYETAAVYVQDTYNAHNYAFKLSTIKPFYNDATYINALTESIKPYLNNPYDLVLFSYHGIPERHVKKTDMTGKHCLTTGDCCNVASEAHSTCYNHQVKVTTAMVAAQLEIPKGKFATSFQSRLGRDAWLKPYTAKRLTELPKEGIKNLVLVSPAFVSDCLETLEEMAEEGKELFMEAGGESFTLVPCLNTDANWIATVEHLIAQHVEADKALATA
jgi:protoporphyrin/coproporphyrin ferrochelatase